MTAHLDESHYNQVYKDPPEVLLVGYLYGKTNGLG